MKGLLHSKRLRKNLFKWVIMYIGTIGLLTTVITYSKYISNLQSYDGARVAKFQIEIIPKEACSVGEDKICDNSRTYRPTSNINYQFIVDTSNIEVRTDFVLTILINNEFNMTSLTDEDNNQVITTKNSSITGYDSYSIKSTIEVDKPRPEKEKKKVYKLTVKHKESDVDAKNKKYEIVKIGYSAKQVTK